MKTKTLDQDCVILRIIPQINDQMVDLVDLVDFLECGKRCNLSGERGLAI